MGQFQGKKGKRGDKKHGRNATKCARYSREHRREKNKILRITRHVRQHPHDRTAIGHIARLRDVVVG